MRDKHQPGCAATALAIGLGSHALGVAIHTTDLYDQGRFPLIVLSGANAPTTLDRFPDGEAVHYTREAIARGVPETQIRTETRATNTGEDIRFTRHLLAAEGIHPQSATLVTGPGAVQLRWTVGAVTLGCLLCYLGVYGASAAPDFGRQVWVVPFILCGIFLHRPCGLALRTPDAEQPTTCLLPRGGCRGARSALTVDV